MIVFDYIFSLSFCDFIFHMIGCFLAVQFAKFILFSFWNVIKQTIPLNDILTKYSQKNKQNPQCWAVITGATDGIGLGFVEVLTQLGFDICLISRNQQKLNKTVDNIKRFRSQKFHNRKFMTIQFDFSDSSNQSKFEQMIQKVKKLDIGILVNNVGTSQLKQFQDFSLDEIKKIINVNCSSMALMAGALLKQMKNRSAKSAMINLSSFAGQKSIPYITLYSATKSMNTFFSEGISMEVPEMDILSVRPMFVESPLSQKKKGFNIPDRRQCALACLKQLRWEYQTNGYILHRISAKFLQLFVPTYLHRLILKKFAHREIQQYAH